MFFLNPRLIKFKVYFLESDIQFICFIYISSETEPTYRVCFNSWHTAASTDWIDLTQIAFIYPVLMFCSRGFDATPVTYFYVEKFKMSMSTSWSALDVFKINIIMFNFRPSLQALSWLLSQTHDIWCCNFLISYRWKYVHNGWYIKVRHNIYEG